jgi:hypothetical protein
MASVRFGWVVLAVPLGAAGCSAEVGDRSEGEGAVATDVQGLNGHGFFSADNADCFVGQRRARAEWALAAANDIIRHDLFPQCLQEHYVTGAEGDSPETIVRRLREDMPTLIRCADLLYGRPAQAPVNVSEEQFTFDNAYLDDSTKTDIDRAAVIVHEVAHNKRYRHNSSAENDDPAAPFKDSVDYKFSVNEQVEACARSTGNNTFGPDYGLGPITVGNGSARGGLTRGTKQAPIGAYGGSPKILEPGNALFARGLYGYARSRVDSIGFITADMNGIGSSPGYTPQFGGLTTDPYLNDCGPGNLLIGIEGFATNLVNSMSGLCRTASDVLNNGSAYWTTGFAGQYTGDYYFRMCPNQMVVKRALVRTGSAVDRVELECEHVGSGQTQAKETLGSFGSSTSGTAFREQCPPGSVMDGLTGSANSRVDRLGATCRAVTRRMSGRTAYIAMTGGGAQMALEWHGSWNGYTWTSDKCPIGMAIIGIDARSGSALDQVRAICANVSQWSDERIATENVLWEARNIHGGSGGNPKYVECQRQYFMHGWDIRADSGVRYLRPICVRAED